MNYTIGEIIDKLSITNIKIYHAVMKAHQEEDKKLSLELFKKSFEMNKERIRIINEVNKYFDEKKNDNRKTY